MRLETTATPRLRSSLLRSRARARAQLRTNAVSRRKLMPTDSGWKRNSLLPNKLLGMRRMLLAAGLVAAMSWTGAWMTAGAVGGETAATPARIIDRTLLCSTLLQAGAREITVYATAAVPGQKEPGGSVTDPSSLKQKLPEVSLSTGSFDPT